MLQPLPPTKLFNGISNIEQGTAEGQSGLSPSRCFSRSTFGLPCSVFCDSNYCFKNNNLCEKNTITLTIASLFMLHQETLHLCEGRNAIGAAQGCGGQGTYGTGELQDAF